MITTFSTSTLETMEQIKNMGCPRLDCEVVQTKDGYKYLMVSFLQSDKDEWPKGTPEWQKMTVWDRMEEPKESFKVGEGMYRCKIDYVWYLEIDGNIYYATNY